MKKILLFFSIILVIAAPISAQVIEVPNPLGSTSDIPTLIDLIATWLLGIGSTIGVIIIFWAAFLFMTAGGNKDRVTQARKTLLYAVIGIVALLLARSVVPFLTNLLGGSAANAPAIEQKITDTDQNQTSPPQSFNFTETEEPTYGFSILDETQLTSPAPDIEIPGSFPDNEIQKLEDIRVGNSNAYIDEGSFPNISDQQKLKQIVGAGLNVFSDQYKNASANIVILDKETYEQMQREGYGLTDQKAKDNMARSNATADEDGLILVNGDRLLKGIGELNPTGYNSNEAPEDLIVHENAHTAMTKCNCINNWYDLKLQLLSEGKQNSGYASQYAQEGGAQEDFAEMVVAYKNSGGDPSKIFPNSNQNLDREVLAKKFEFLREHNIVR